MSTIINISNYEAYWVDYLDGNLTITQEDALFAFLETHNEIAGNLIDADNYKLPKFEIEFPNKSQLHSDKQIENLLIAKLEAEISSENDEFISNKINSDTKIAQSFSLYKKTIITPDNSIVFPSKKSLKKTVRVPLFHYASSIAAAIIIVFISGYFLTRNIDTNINGTTPLTSDINIVPLPFNNNNNESDNNNDNNIIPKQTIETINNQFANNNPVIQEQLTLKKLPLNKTKQLNYIASNSISEIMEYRYDLPQEDLAFSYTMEYTKTSKKDHFMSNVNKVKSFGKNINVKESWDNIKTAKEEFLYSNIEE